MSNLLNPLSSQPTSARFRPQINPNRCEGKGVCVAACPVDVLEMGLLPSHERKSLSFLGGLKAWAHGYKQARVSNAAACLGCGECVRRCPEDAITLLNTSTL